MEKTFDRPSERWQHSKNPYTLARLVKQQGVDGRRKYRLVAAACCRRAWPTLDAKERRALEVVERYADGEAKYTEMRLAVQGMRIAGYRSHPLLVEAARRDAWSGLAEVIARLLGILWSGAPKDLEEEQNGPYGRYWTQADEWQRECAMLCHIVRDCFANVYQPIPIVPAWRTAAVLGLAQAAYAQRALPAANLESPRLGILADALEDAGCGNRVILEHLRGPGPHVPGCWLIDSLLGKQP